MSISTPKNLRPSFFATTRDEPAPANGSKTRAPRFVLARISLASSFSGFCVGWSVFSGIDQKGTVISFHRFDGCVTRKRPRGVACQSFGAPVESVYGAMTLREVEQQTGVSSEVILRELGLPPGLPVDERLGRLRRQYGFRMDDLREVVRKHTKNK